MYGVSNIMVEKMGNWQYELDKISELARQNKNMSEFGSLSDNKTRIEHIMHNKYIENVAWVISYLASSRDLHCKSTEKSKLYRDRGNDLFKQKRYEDALEKYTEAILHAPMNGESPEELALGYGNRSAVFFHLTKFQECVNDINLALRCSSGFPADKAHKLYLRRAYCFTRLSQKESAEKDLILARKSLADNPQLCTKRKDVLQREIESLEAKIKQSQDMATPKTEKQDSIPGPSYGPNSVLTQASGAVHMEYSSDKGRYLVANRQLSTGDVLMVERPFAAVLLPDHYSGHCHHCFCSIIAAYPCHQCSTVRFCSNQCWEQAWNLYHNVECPYLDLLHSVGIAHLSLRVILIASLPHLLDFRLSSESFKSKKIESKCLTEGGKYERSYRAVYHLLPHSENMHTEDLFQYSLTAGLLLKVLKHSGWFKSKGSLADCGDITGTSSDCSLSAKGMESTGEEKRNVPDGDSCKNTHCKFDNNLEERIVRITLPDSGCDCPSRDLDEEVYIGELLLRHIQQLVCNAHAITELQVSHDDDQTRVDSLSQVRVATAIYPTASLMNHSCDPTIISSFFKDTLVVRTVKDVSPGEEIFNCYGPHYKRMKKLERQQVLRDQYFFECRCQPCSVEEGEEISTALRCPDCEYGVFLSEKLCCKHCGFVTDGQMETAKAASAEYLFVEGLTALKNGDIELATKKFLKCYKDRKEILYKHNSQLAETQDCLARCYAMLGKYKKSAKFLRLSVETMSVVYGEQSVELANELHKFAEVLFNAGEPAEAMSVTESAIRILTVVYGSSHSSVVELEQLKLNLSEYVKMS